MDLSRGLVKPEMIAYIHIRVSHLAWSLFQLLPLLAQIHHKVADRDFSLYVDAGYSRVAAVYNFMTTLMQINTPYLLKILLTLSSSSTSPLSFGL
jgi:hypothetical protein